MTAIRSKYFAFRTQCFLYFFLTVSLFSSIISRSQIELSHFNGFSFYTEENGLPSTYITDIREDKHGFLWIGTANGVSRYDGNQFTNFIHYSDNIGEHKLGFVNSLVMNKSGDHFWIACSDGIFFTSIDTIQFRKIEETIPSINNSPMQVTGLFLDGENKLWSASNKNGLHLYDLENKKHKQFLFKDSSNYSNSKLNSLQCIVNGPIDSNILWIGSMAGLIKFNSNTNEYKVFEYNKTPELAQNNIRRIHTSETEVFLGTWKKGLIVFDKQTQQFSQALFQKYPNSHLLILNIYQDLENKLWITSSDGLIQYNTKTKSVTNVTDHNTTTGLFRGVSFFDSRGIVWFGFGKGLFKYDPLHTPVEFIKLENRNKIQNPLLVREIIRSNNFVYVAGQFSSGLYKINMLDKSFEVIKIPMFNYHKKVGYNLMDMLDMGDGNYLLISGKKIAIFNQKTQKSISSPLQINHPNPSFQCIVKDRNNNYWLGTRAGGLSLLNFNQKTIRTFKDEFNVFRDGNHRWINNLLIDSNNKLWIGKGSSSVMDLNNLSIRLIDPNNESKIKTFKDVDEFYEDKTGIVWLAGGSNGLGYTNFKNFDKGVTHLADGYFSGIYPLNDSLIWLTGKNLGIFNKNTSTYNRINLNSNNRKFRITGPIIPYKDEEFIIGCDNGILIYNNQEQIPNPEKPIPYISWIEGNGEILYEGNNLTKNTFKLKQGTDYLAIGVSSLGFHFSNQINYQYRIEGEWQDIGTDLEINLTNLSYGDYKFQLRTINNQGISSKEPREYLIKIPSPWWVRWWAVLIYLGLAVLFADRFYRFQLSKKLAIAETVKLKELSKLRNSFYTNITHEFRTPLTVILGMVDSLKSVFETNKSNTAGHSIEMIERNGKNLLHLVNEMLDLSKVESGNSELQLIQADVIPFIKYLSESFYSLATEKQIGLTVYAEVDELIMDFDTNKLTTIISNLLSNAIKFTYSGGEIIIHINEVMIDKANSKSITNKYLSIKIKDNGQGIDSEELKNIFNRFYQVDNDSSRRGEGTGIGLTLTREFIELMNGSISVNSKPEVGSEFTILLPIQNQAIFTTNIHKQLEPSLYSPTTQSEKIQINSDDDSELPLALIIEDNADVTHYLETCLTGKYQTLNASSGDKGVEAAYEKVPDIIICDIMMPVKNGFEVCEELKSDERTDHIPIILLTAKVALKDKLAGLSCGADAYLTKPFVKAELLTRLDQLVLSRKKLLQKINDDTLGKILKNHTEDPETKFLQKIITIIRDETGNHSFGSSLHLARKMHLSESQIYRKLKAITGKSTAVFIRSVRLQKAKELLQTSNKSISEIAYEVGFNDPSWFSRAFKEEFGFAPSDMSN